MEDLNIQSFRPKKMSKTNLPKSSSSISSVKKKRSLKSRSSNLSEEESEISPEEEKALIVSLIAQSLVDLALDVIYEKYLKKQTVFFISHCSRLAWKALIDWNYQRKDPGGFQKIQTDMHAIDTEPEPSPKDSWAGKSILFAEEKDDSPLTFGKRENTRTSLLGSGCFEGTPTPAESEKSLTFEEARTMTVKKAREILKQTFHKKQKRSVDLTRVPSQSGVVEFKKESYELPSPILMPAKKFPPFRVDVKYSITPGVKGLVSRKPPKSKTIRLDKPKKEVQ